MPKFLISFHCSETPEKPDIYEVMAKDRKLAIFHAARHQACRYNMTGKTEKEYIDLIIDSFNQAEYTMDHQEQRPVVFEAYDDGVEVDVAIIPIFNVEVPEARLVNVTA